ncbi:MAG: DUF1015 domain-containing protein [Roseburia sp.]|nr:DUF1015 domain-containing protein [Roseburia sp.]
MAIIRPFIGIRPNKGKAAKIAALPYDVYNREEAKKVVTVQPESFLAIDRAETNFTDDISTYDEVVYEKARELLWERVEKGDFIRERNSCYYIYELTMNGRSQTGIVACASIDDYKNNVIKKHENTREEKELDRIHHVDTCSAQTGPIFLAYRAHEGINEVIRQVKMGEAEYDFVSEDGVRHRVFVIFEEAQIATIEQAFLEINEIYIADGHHRCASAVKVAERRRVAYPDYTGKEEFNYFLSVLFPDEELYIMDYNRVLKDLNGYTAQTFYDEVTKRFDVEEITEKTDRHPEKKGTFTMYLEGSWYACTIRPKDIPRDAHGVADPVKALDVSLLQDMLLDPVLGIDDPKTNARIDFVGGIRGLDELVRRCNADCAVAFAMYPTSIQELFDVADAGFLMPPKSTWFEPKLRSGLFIHEIER